MKAQYSLLLRLLLLATLIAGVLVALAGHPRSAILHMTALRMVVTSAQVAVAPHLGRAVVWSDKDSTITLLDSASGAIVRTIPVGSDHQAIEIDEHTQRVFIVNYLDGATMLDARTGQLLSTVPTGAESFGMAMDIQDGRVFVLNTDPSVSMLDARTGRLLHTAALDGLPNGIAVDEHTQRAFVTTDAGTISELDMTRGAVLRTMGVGTFDPRSGRMRILDTSPASIGFAASDLAMAIDPRNGRVYLLNGDSSTSNYAGSISVLDGRTGRLLRTVSVGVNPTGMVLDTRTARLYVTNQGTDTMPGSLCVLDTQPLHVRHTLQMGANPVAVAVDERKGHVIVIVDAGMTRAPDPWGWVPTKLRRLLPFTPAHQRRIPPSAILIDASRL